MINIIISGIYGKMGQIIQRRIDLEEDIKYAGGVDIIEGEEAEDINVVNNIGEIISKADIVVDFSNASGTIEKIPICVKHKKGMVIGTTGFSEKDLEKIRDASSAIPILLASMYSINFFFITSGHNGCILMKGLCKYIFLKRPSTLELAVSSIPKICLTAL